MISLAHAQTAGGPAGDYTGLIMMVAMFAILWFMMIRPQMKRAKEHKAMVAALAVGDEVVTAAGILGKVTETGDQFLTVELADGVRVKVQRHTIGAVLPKGTLKNA